MTQKNFFVSLIALLFSLASFSQEKTITGAANADGHPSFRV